MIHIIFLSYLFSNICIIKKVTNKKNLRTIIGFGTAFNNIGLGTCLALGFGIAMQKIILILRNLLHKSNLFTFIIHFATEMLQPISNY